jgi:hypothetical protein
MFITKYDSPHSTVIIKGVVNRQVSLKPNVSAPASARPTVLHGEDEKSKRAFF